MKKILFFCFLFLLFTFPAGTVRADADPSALEDIRQVKPDTWTCTFEGVRHTFLLELPEHPEGSPLAVLLPGYGNTAEAFRESTHFETEANAMGYAVVYVTGAPAPGDPASAVGWNSDPRSSGNSDAAFLTSLAAYLQETWALDPARTYAAGFSNGAFMAHRLAMEASGTFSAAVSVAGLMPEGVWEERSETNRVSFFQITGEKDDVIPKKSDGSDRYSPAPAIEDVVEYWAGSNGLSRQDAVTVGNGSVLTKYGSPETGRQVWHLLVRDGRHSWPEEKYTGIDTASLILEFWETVAQ